jgi:hypothetical protein
MIDMRYLLAALATWMPWAQIESPLALLAIYHLRPGRVGIGADLFGMKSEVVGSVRASATRVAQICRSA